jgi:hypothetical protein
MPPPTTATRWTFSAIDTYALNTWVLVSFFFFVFAELSCGAQFALAPVDKKN